MGMLMRRNRKEPAKQEPKKEEPKNEEAVDSKKKALRKG